MTTLDRSWRLWLDRETGKLHGAKITMTYNQPWPCRKGEWGSGTMRGVVEHTMVGTLAGTIATFNDLDNNVSASANFGVAQDGHSHQFGPVGQGWISWHAAAANREFYGIEFEDYKAGQPREQWPRNPISDHALTAGAQIIEFLSRFAGFPLWEMVRYTGQGLGYHRQFWEWNPDGHSCPGATFADDVRVNQRAELLRRAHQIRG